MYYFSYLEAFCRTATGEPMAGRVTSEELGVALALGIADGISARVRDNQSHLLPRSRVLFESRHADLLAQPPGKIAPTAMPPAGKSRKSS